MDSIRVSEAPDTGSIPVEATKSVTAIDITFYGSVFSESITNVAVFNPSPFVLRIILPASFVDFTTTMSFPLLAKPSFLLILA